MAEAGPGAVLDFDGVIVRSMEQHAEAYRRVLAPLGIGVRDEQVFWREGARSERILRDLVDEAGQAFEDLTLARLSDDKQTIYQALGPPLLYDGARAMVLAVRAAAPRLGLVTGTRRANLERAIPDLLPRFDVVLAAKDYAHDKPHPEPYEKAAAALGLPPVRCVALENAPRGVESARAAGYGHVVGIATTLPPDALRRAGADVVVERHDAAAEAVVAWLRAAGAPAS